jgi:signal transduction histidine kinase
MHNAPMMDWIRRYRLWIVAGLVASALGAAGLARLQLAQLRDAFETDARIAHRLLSQRLAQNDAVLATLALLQPQAQASAPEQRLVALYPQILGVQRRDRDAAWTDARLAAAETLSRAVRRPALAGVDLAGARYQLVLAAEPASFALRMDLRATVPWNEWPMAPDTSPVRVALVHEGQHLVLQPGRIDGSGWRFDFRKPWRPTASPSTWWPAAECGRPALGLDGRLVAGAGLATAGLRGWLRQRGERRRAQELLRLGQVGRLNALGELAAGMAHELNQPLTAVSGRCAGRPAPAGRRPARPGHRTRGDGQAVQQARRAADVVARLRRLVERPDVGSRCSPAPWRPRARRARPAGARVRTPGGWCSGRPTAAAVQAQADPVALEQIVHNLLSNALQALAQVPRRRAPPALHWQRDGATASWTVADSGPGIAPEALPRLFEPFFTTRDGGLGLGLSLCESLATGMGGALTRAMPRRAGPSSRCRLPASPADRPPRHEHPHLALDPPGGRRRRRARRPVAADRHRGSARAGLGRPAGLRRRAGPRCHRRHRAGRAHARPGWHRGAGAAAGRVWTSRW